MSSPPPVTTPGSNVTPMWGGSWPGRPPASPPSCFSQLYGLNQCYDDIIMMKQILAKVVCDLATNDPAFQQCLAEGIAKSGSGVPLLGVTDGSNAQPGQVGEWVQYEVTGIPVVAGAATTTPVSMGVLQPGDWDCMGTFQDFAWSEGNLFYLSPDPAGFSTNMFGVSISAATPVFAQANTIVGTPARASITAPTLVVFSVTTNYPAGGIQAGQVGTMIFQARRAR